MYPLGDIHSTCRPVLFALLAPATHLLVYRPTNTSATLFVGIPFSSHFTSWRVGPHIQVGGNPFFCMPFSPHLLVYGLDPTSINPCLLIWGCPWLLCGCKLYHFCRATPINRGSLLRGQHSAHVLAPWFQQEGNLTFEVRLHNDGRVLVIMEDFPSNVSAMRLDLVSALGSCSFPSIRERICRCVCLNK